MWHPQANGQTEHFNKSLANMLTVYCEEYHENWDEYLPYLAFCYNSGASETTKISPFKVIYGRDPRFPTELGLGTANYTGPGALTADIEANFKIIHDIVLTNTGLVQHRMIIRANKTKPQKEYRVGDKVWLYTPLKTINEKDKNDETVCRAKKLKFPWQGPYEVIQQVNPNVVNLHYSDGHQLGQGIHVNCLKPYKERISEKIPDLATNDSFNPAEERVVDKTTLGVDEPEPENEQVVREMT